MNCQKCNALISDKATFCAKCSGVPVPTLVRTPHHDPFRLRTPVSRSFAGYLVFFIFFVLFKFLGIFTLLGYGWTMAAIVAAIFLVATAIRMSRGLPMRIPSAAFNSGPAAAARAAIASGKPGIMEDLLRILLETQPATLDGAMANAFGLAKDVPSRNMAAGREAGDNMLHYCMLITGTGNPPELAKPAAVLFESRIHTAAIFEYYCYKASPEGMLLEAVRFLGKTGSQGELAMDAQSRKMEDVGSLDVQKRFRHELDLWLSLGQKVTALGGVKRA